MSDAPNLVPNRSCGSCTACCKEPTINEPDIRKLPGVLCEHCEEGVGCRIYETRPTVCRSWHCAWRKLGEPGMGEDWRPDRCGLLTTFVTENIPSEFNQLGLMFDIIGNPGDLPLDDHPVLSWEPLLQFVTTAVQKRFPVFLCMPAPPGYAGEQVFLNYLAAQPAMMRDKNAMIAALREAYRIGSTAPKQRVSIAGGI